MRVSTLWMALFVIVLLLLYGLSPSYCGLYGVVLSLIGIVSSRSLLTLLLSFLNFSVSIAFDYYLRVWDYGFEFYDSRGIGVTYLSFVSLFLYVYVLGLDWKSYSMSGVPFRYALVPDINYNASPVYYYPLLIAVVWCSYFVYANAGSMFSYEFDLKELQKFSFLEYFSIIIFFLIRSSNSDLKKAISIFSSLLLIMVMLLASYRMVSIIYVLALVLAVVPGYRLARSYVIVFWLFVYLSLAAISYIRGDDPNLDFSKLLGYKQYGYLDNTFTGVIETALIYSTVYEGNSFSIRVKEFLGTVLPLPGFLIPSEMIYYSNLDDKYEGRIPGGGLLAGFVIYFDYLLLPIFMGYMSIVYKNISRTIENHFFMFFVFVAFVSVSRWWLYGPYVLFKFLGVFVVFYIVDAALKRYSSVFVKI